MALDTPLGIDIEGARLARLRTLLFAPKFSAAEPSGEPVVQGDGDISVTPAWSTFEARSRVVASTTVSHLRIRSFHTRDVLGFVNEFIRLLGKLPQAGLVLDIRATSAARSSGPNCLCRRSPHGRSNPNRRSSRPPCST